MWISIGLLWLIYLFLFLKSRKLPCEGKRGLLQKTLYRMSEAIVSHPLCRRLYKESVRQDLKVLYPFGEVKDTLKRYYAEKLCIVLLVLFAGVHLIAIISFANQQTGILQENHALVRGNYEQAPSDVTLQIKEETGETHEIPYEVRSREYSQAEIQQKTEAFEKNIEGLILGNNKTLEEVTEKLVLTDSYPGYPMEMEWESEDYTLIDSDGTVYNEELSEKRITKLTVHIEYMEYEFEYTFPVCVCPREYTQKEQMELAILEQLHEADDRTRAEEKMILPEKIGGKNVFYSVPAPQEELTYFLFLGIVLLVLFYAKDQDLTKESERRKNEMTMEYPEFVSKFVLLLGAGMTVRNIFLKMSQDAMQSRFLKQELVILVRDFNNGILEAEALDRFGKRSGNPLYIKFCALIIQNLKKGTKDLMPMLEQESKEAFQLRKNNAKRLGEEAGTKLLVPMILMLGIVMVLIMVPAFLSFQL